MESKKRGGKMKRLLLLSTVTLLLVILIGGSAFATVARIRALGNQDYFFKDIYHIYANPAYLGSYTNSVYGELGTYQGRFIDGSSYDPADQFLGINYKIYKGLSLGLALNRKDCWDPTPTTFDSLPGFAQKLHERFNDIVNPSNDTVTIPSAQNPYEFIASYDLEKIHFGVSLYRAGNTREFAYSYNSHIDSIFSGSTRRLFPFDSTYSYDWKLSSSNTTLKGGFLFELSEKYSVEAAIRLGFDKAKGERNISYRGLLPATGLDTNTTVNTVKETIKSEGGTGIAFQLRGFFELLENFQVVPLFEFSSKSMAVSSVYDSSGTRFIYGTGTRSDSALHSSYKSGDYKDSYFIIALGGNLKLDKGMVAGGIHLRKEKVKDESVTKVTDQSTTWYMPGFNLGAEYELTKWLTARLGMQKWFGKNEHKVDNLFTLVRESQSDTKSRFSSSDEDFIGAGVGFKFSKFQIDATVGDNNFFEGTYLLSGVQRNLFGTMSVVFTF